MYISLRQKIAGKTEAKKVTGLNFEEIKNKLISEGIEPTAEEIKSRLLDESNLVISNNQKDLILNLNLSDSARKRVNEVEAALIIIGIVLNENNANTAIEDFNWYLETMELKPGDLGITQENISNVSKIKESFNKIYNKVSEEKRASEEISKESSNDSYLSNEVVYDFGDGWKVVYVPAVGEMEGFPGLKRTSHDRVLEGNKNGLCLGSGARYYQDNREGKIYSVRDPSNKPRVTIRINENFLEEAKGKNNNPPDIEAAQKADIWFKSIDNLEYKDSQDYIAFPPLNIENAKESFLVNKDKAYLNGWAPHWYGKGIRELDEDIERKISENNPSLIIGGFGKYPAFFEKIKPVVIYWCNEYLKRNTDAAEVLFGINGRPPTHEVFKTYKRLNEMSLAVKMLSEYEHHSNYFFILGLHKIKEYEKYIQKPSKKFASENPKEFLEKFSEEPWAQPYLDLTAKNYAEENPREFLEKFSEKPWAQIYLDGCLSSIIYNNNYHDKEFIIKKLFNKNFAKERIKEVISSMVNYEPGLFLTNLYNYDYINTLDSSAINKIINETFKKLRIVDINYILESSYTNLDNENNEDNEEETYDSIVENKEKYDKILINKLSENTEYIKKLFSISSFENSMSILDFCLELPMVNYRYETNFDDEFIKEILDIVYQKSKYTDSFSAIFEMAGHKRLDRLTDLISNTYDENIKNKIIFIYLNLLKNLSSKNIPESYLKYTVWSFIANLIKFIKKDVVISYAKLIINNIKNNNPLFFLKNMYFKEDKEVDSYRYDNTSRSYILSNNLYDIFKEELSTIPSRESLYNISKKDGANTADTIFNYILSNEEIKENKVNDILFEFFEKNYSRYINKLDQRDIEFHFKKIAQGRVKGHYLVNFFKNKDNLEILINKYFIDNDFNMRLFSLAYESDFKNLFGDKNSEVSIAMIDTIRNNVKNIFKIYYEKHPHQFIERAKRLLDPKRDSWTKNFIFYDNVELLKQYISLYEEKYNNNKKISNTNKLIEDKKLIKLSNIIINFDKEEAKNIYKLAGIYRNI
jgi:hypothetical protein